VLICYDTEQDARVDQVAARKVNARSMVVTPLIDRGQAMGVLKIMADRPHAFSDDDIQTLQMMAGLMSAAIDHQMSFDEVQHLLKARTLALESKQQEITLRQQVEEELAANAERTRRIL